MKRTLKKIFLGILLALLNSNAFAWSSDDYIWDFNWLEPNNRVEVAVGESHQLQYTSSTNTSKAFTADYSSCWIHYDFSPMQHIVESPVGYTIDENGVLTGLVPGSYAIKFTSVIQAASGADKWLYITVVSEKKETESNNDLGTANEFTTKIRCGLYNSSDIDYFKYKHNFSYGTYIKFKVHYIGSRENPFGYKWATFSGSTPQMVGGGSLSSQDQECNVLVTSGNYVYFELYYDQNRSQYFNYGEEFVIEVVSNPVVNVETVTLDKSTCTLYEGESVELIASVLPQNATDKTLTWSSSNTSVATVSEGVVTAVSQGSVTITAKSNDGSNISASCQLTVEKKVVPVEPVGSAIRLWYNGSYQEIPVSNIDSITFVAGDPYNGHEYVDLGLPSGLKWATCNVGAESPEDYGDYFAWGETSGYNSGKTYFYWDSYKYCNGSSSTITKYCTRSNYGTVDNKTVLEAADDAASVNWGGSWRMPTDAEMTELRTKCIWTWTTQNGVKGYKVVGPNGNFLFLPAAGYRFVSDLDLAGSYGNYWSSSLDTFYSGGACSLGFDSGSHDWYCNDRYCGFSVRPVCQ